MGQGLPELAGRGRVRVVADLERECPSVVVIEVVDDADQE